ncbi:MAG: metal ABC transporter ATP-binding protein [Bacillota bacterium]|jgi:zinc transport system ATP-binding protein
MQLLSCQNIKLGYGDSLAVDNVSFDLENGDYLCIVGENGSGKSTLMKGLLGLLKPWSGCITFNGIQQSQIGYLPQKPLVQKDFPASVFEVVLSGCLNRRGLFPFYSKKEKERVLENISRLGISELKRQSFRDLSGGQQQRVLLARALCATEKLLMLDEPVAGLDPMMTSELYDLINKLNHDLGITIIMVSHDIRSAVKYGNKILHMQKSSAFFGIKEKYMTTDICHKMMGGAQHA